MYRPQLTSVLSIFHRACGAALAIGLLLVAAVLIAAALGETQYDMVMGLIGTKIGILLLFGWSVALFYHLSNGIRHLIWDTGNLFKIKNAYLGGYLVLLSTVILTGLTWWCGCPFTMGVQ